MPQGEVVSIHCGQCGINTGAKFWQMVAQEHGLSPDGVCADLAPFDAQDVGNFFEPMMDGKHRPRARFLDTDPLSMEILSSESFGPLFSMDGARDQRICIGDHRSSQLAGVVWAEDMGVLHDSIIHEAEKCDRLSAFQITVGIGGGTGSEFAARSAALIEEYYQRPVMVHCVYNQDDQAGAGMGSMFSPYNTVASLPRLIDSGANILFYDQGGLTRQCEQAGVENPKFGDLNYLVACAMSSVTCGSRFRGDALMTKRLGQLCQSLRVERDVCLFDVAFGPCVGELDLMPETVDELTRAVVFSNTCLCEKIELGRYTNLHVIYRGASVGSRAVAKALHAATDRHSSYVCEWMSHNVSASICPVAQPGFAMTATRLGGTTGARSMLSSLTDRFSAMFRRQPFLHHFTREGVDAAQLTEGNSRLGDLARQLQEFQDRTIDEKGSEGGSENK